MVVNEVDFERASKSVSDSFKIPWLYSIEALFKGEDVFASLPTRYGSNLPNSTDRCTVLMWRNRNKSQSKLVVSMM